MNEKSDSSTELDRLCGQLAEKEQEIKALQARIDALSRHDSLTGALNRSALLQEMETELQRARRTGHPFCFAVIDLDRFAQINDSHGQAAGDLVLKTVAETARKLLRVVDRLGRTEGEAFGIVLPSTWLEQAVIAMSRLTTAVSAVRWEEIGAGLSVTFCAGLTVNAPTDTAETLLRRAEKALLQAKQEGPGRLVQVEEELPDMERMDLL